MRMLVRRLSGCCRFTVKHRIGQRARAPRQSNLGLPARPLGPAWFGGRPLPFSSFQMPLSDETRNASHPAPRVKQTRTWSE